MARARSPVRRAVAIAARVFAVVVAIALVAVVALVGYVRTASGERALRERVEAAVSDAMAGSMEVEKLEMDWPDTVHARGLVFRDPDGRAVLAIDRAEVKLEPWQLLRRRLIFEKVRVRGARLTLASKGGDLGIERAFAAAKRDEPKDEEESGGLGVVMKNAHVQGVRVTLAIADAPRLEFEDVEGFIALRLDPNKPVRIRLDRVSGKLTEAPVDVDVRLEGLKGAIHAKAAESVDLEFGGSIDGDRMSGALRYYPDRERKAEIELDVPEPSFRTAVMSLGLGAAGRLSSALRVERSMGGRERRDTR